MTAKLSIFTHLAGAVAVDQGAVQQSECRLAAGASLARRLQVKPAAEARAGRAARRLPQRSVVSDDHTLQHTDE